MLTNNSTSRRRKFAISLAVAPLLFAACGDSSSGPAGGATAASWCEFADESDAIDDIFNSFSTDKEAMKAGLAELEALIKRLPGEAPDEIKDAAKVLADATQMIVDAIEKADYSILDADLAFMEEGTLEADVDAASDELDAFTETNCGRSFSGDEGDDAGNSDPGESGTTESDTGESDSSETDESDFNPADGTIREQLVTQFQSIGLSAGEAECIADKLDFNDPSVQSGDVGAMLDVFEECGISLERLAELGG